MSFTDAEKVSIRHHMGYPTYGAGPGGFQGWRFFTAYGVLEYKLNNLSVDEETRARGYITNCELLENAILTAGANLGTASASVFTRNPMEHQDRERLYLSWRMKLCNFLGQAPGPNIGGGMSADLVV